MAEEGTAAVSEVVCVLNDFKGSMAILVESAKDSCVFIICRGSVGILATVACA